jgi:hypothetical protein
MTPELFVGTVAVLGTLMFLLGNGFLWWGATYKPALRVGLTVLGGACVFHGAVGVLLLTLPI